MIAAKLLVEADTALEACNLLGDTLVGPVGILAWDQDSAAVEVEIADSLLEELPAGVIDAALAAATRH